MYRPKDTTTDDPSEVSLVMSEPTERDKAESRMWFQIHETDVFCKYRRMFQAALASGRGAASTLNGFQRFKRTSHVRRLHWRSVKATGVDLIEH